MRLTLLLLAACVSEERSMERFSRRFARESCQRLFACEPEAGMVLADRETCEFRSERHLGVHRRCMAQHCVFSPREARACLRATRQAPCGRDLASDCAEVWSDCDGQEQECYP